MPSFLHRRPDIDLYYNFYRYGNGYTVSLFFERRHNVERGLAFAASRFPESTVKVRNTTIQFQVAKEPPSVIFGHILANRQSLGIQDFAVKHTTLDEVSQEIKNIGIYFHVNTYSQN